MSIKRVAGLGLFILSAGMALAGPPRSMRGDSDLARQARELFGALPKVFESQLNPVTPAKITLGKMLFYESRVSVDGTVSCVRCHPFSLYAQDGLPKSVGHDGQRNVRNSPTVLNAGGQISAHWVGNRKDVEEQAEKAVLGAMSFGMPSNGAVEKILKGIGGYRPFFEKAFPGEPDPITVANFGRAVGAFIRTLVTPDSFDNFMAGSDKALTSAQKDGLRRFMETGCATCHAGAMIGGNKYEKFGLLQSYWRSTKSKDIDEGRVAVTKNEDDRYVFKVPTLRNVEMTAPYFHDGSVAEMAEAISIMGKIQLGKALLGQEVEEIISFLKCLTGPIPEEALKVPVLPPSEPLAARRP